MVRGLRRLLREIVADPDNSFDIVPPSFPTNPLLAAGSWGVNQRPKKRGPQARGKGEPILVRLQPAQLAALDALDCASTCSVDNNSPGENGLRGVAARYCMLVPTDHYARNRHDAGSTSPRSLDDLG